MIHPLTINAINISNFLVLGAPHSDARLRMAKPSLAFALLLVGAFQTHEFKVARREEARRP